MSSDTTLTDGDAPASAQHTGEIPDTMLSPSVRRQTQDARVDRLAKLPAASVLAIAKGENFTRMLLAYKILKRWVDTSRRKGQRPGV